MQKRKDKLVKVVSILIILVSLIYIAYSSYSIKEIREVGMDLRISKKSHLLGVNPEGDALHFGLVPKNGRSHRDITLSHDFAYPLKVNVKSMGNITDFVRVSENNFILEPGESKELKVTVSIPSRVKPGNYDGTLRVFFQKPLIY